MLVTLDDDKLTMYVVAWASSTTGCAVLKALPGSGDDDPGSVEQHRCRVVPAWRIGQRLSDLSRLAAIYSAALEELHD